MKNVYQGFQNEERLCRVLTKDVRHFGLAHATTPVGEWHVESKLFVSGGQLAASPKRRWTDEVSHGELLTQPGRLRFLILIIDGMSIGRYALM
jgi:hypothetical protein